MVLLRRLTYVFDNFNNLVLDSGYTSFDGTQHVGTNLLDSPFKTSGTFFADSYINDVATYAYDAAIVMGMAACDYVAAGNTMDGDFSGPELYQFIKQLNFNSVTGNVQFDSTGSRLASSGNYIMWNHRSEAADANPKTHMVGSWTDAEGWSWTKVYDADEGGYRFSGNNPATQWQAPADTVPETTETFTGGGNSFVGRGFFFCWGLGLTSFLVAVVMA